MNWREIQKDETDLLKEAASFERSFPAFYRDASNTWTETEEEAVGFYSRCRLFGVFDKEVVGLVYFEAINPVTTTVHFDMKRGTDKGEVIPCLAGIRNQVFKDGGTMIMTWVLRRNPGIQRLLQTIKFQFSGLEMRAGSSHGRVLRWAQMIVTPAMIGEATE